MSYDQQLAGALKEIEIRNGMILRQADTIDRLTGELAEFHNLKEYAKTLGQETYLHLHAKNEQLQAALADIANVEPKSWTTERAREALIKVGSWPSPASP